MNGWQLPGSANTTLNGDNWRIADRQLLGRKPSVRSRDNRVDKPPFRWRPHQRKAKFKAHVGRKIPPISVDGREAIELGQAVRTLRVPEHQKGLGAVDRRNLKRTELKPSDFQAVVG